MNTLRERLKKIVVILLVLSLLASMAFTVNAVQFAARYDAKAAVSYAQAHWDDGVGVCDQFVKACLLAGGVDIQAGGVESLKNALVDTGLGEEHPLVISADGVHASASENPHVQPGDILFFFCEACDDYIHTVMIAGTNEDGYLYSYGHNPGWDQVDWFGNYTHTLDDGQEHRKLHKCTVVTMNREDFSHAHDFTVDLIEDEHPHRMYAKCSCGSKYYLGWNATISYCTTCNPPAADVPLVTVTREDGAARVTWTTVEGALEYQVWRARNINATYHNIYTAMSTTLRNSSVEMGNTYYYKVVAVLEKDAQGNVTRSATSDVVSFTMSDDSASDPDDVDPPLVTVTREDNAALVTWTHVKDALEYRVWRARSESGTYFNIYTSTGTKLRNTSVEMGNTYYYKVEAVLEKDADGNVTRSATSAVVSFTMSDTAAPKVADISGNYESFGDAADVLTIALIAADKTEASYTFTNASAPANTGTWKIEDVAFGSYTVKVTKENHVEREYTAVVDENGLSLDVEVWLLGDVTGDGLVNFSDYSKVLSQSKKPSSEILTGYAFQCGDVTGDGSINFSDYSKVLSQAKGKHSLW